MRMIFWVLLVLTALDICVFYSNTTAYAQTITIRGAKPSITINTAPPGGDPTPVVNTQSSIRVRPAVSQQTKVTVQVTSITGTAFSLTAVARNPEAGSAAGTVTLTSPMPATNFWMNIPIRQSPGDKYDTTIEYTASARFEDGTGLGTYTIIYTIVTQ